MKYFFFNVNVNMGEFCVKYCSTDRMWAHVLMKLLQGVAFKRICAVLMNCDEDYFEVNENEEVVMYIVDALKSSHTKNQEPQIK